jgi:hypothetical protein
MSDLVVGETELVMIGAKHSDNNAIIRRDGRDRE